MNKEKIFVVNTFDKNDNLTFIIKNFLKEKILKKISLKII